MQTKTENILGPTNDKSDVYWKRFHAQCTIGYKIMTVGGIVTETRTFFLQNVAGKFNQDSKAISVA